MQKSLSEELLGRLYMYVHVHMSPREKLLKTRRGTTISEVSGVRYRAKRANVERTSHLTMRNCTNIS